MFPLDEVKWTMSVKPAADDLYEVLGISKGISEDDVEWEECIDNFFLMTLQLILFWIFPKVLIFRKYNRDI